MKRAHFMAQGTIQVPMAFEFKPRRFSWISVQAEVTGWGQHGDHSDRFYGRDTQCVMVRVPGDDDFRFALNSKCLPGFVRDSEFEQAPDLPDLRKLCQGHTINLLIGSSSEVSKRRSDPWVMRSEFLKLPQENDALATFLNKWGSWGPNAILHTEFLGEVEEIFEMSPQRMDRACVIPSDVWEYQKLCGQALMGPPHIWLGSSHGMLSSAIPRREYPHLLLTANDCAHAIQTTITFDLLRKVKFAVCKRKDCETTFSLETRHKRKYCSWYCGHIESVRKGRKLKAKVK